jgi:hypothetical protein
LVILGDHYWCMPMVGNVLALEATWQTFLWVIWGVVHFGEHIIRPLEIFLGTCGWFWPF